MFNGTLTQLDLFGNRIGSEAVSEIAADGRDEVGMSVDKADDGGLDGEVSSEDARIYKNVFYKHFF